jgi:precorrin-6B methylase 2
VNTQTLGLALIVFGVALAIFLLGTAAIGAGWEPTSRKKVRRMLELSETGPSDVVYDLGSGDGRIVIEAARTYRARAVGVEADPLRVLYSRVAISSSRLEGRAKVVWGNFFHVDLSEATVVTVFLTQGTNQKLKPKLLSDLRPGTRVVSYVWTFEGWAPKARDEKNELALYVVPETGA